MDELNCTGHESDIRKCPHGGWRKSDCGHKEDAGVRCHHPHAQEPEVNNGYSVILLPDDIT